MSGESRRTPRAGRAEQHVGVYHKISGRCKQARVPGDTTHVTRRGVMHDATQYFSWSLVKFSRCDAGYERRGWAEHSVVHPQRLIDFLACKLVEWPTAYSSHDFAQ
jgi:hypothetical protein